MRKRSFLLGTVLGAGLGYLTKQFLDDYKNLAPEIVLERVKDAFRRQGPVSGSWIYIEPVTYEKNGLIYDTYRGGITRTIDQKQIQYEFHADVKSGVIVDAKETD